jgi:Tfp pilus assembly protein PilF
MRLFRLSIIVMCALWSLPAAAGLDDHKWQEVRTEHFRIYTNGNVEDVKGLAREMENFRRIVLLVTGVKDVDGAIPFTMFAAANRGDFKQFFSQLGVVGVFTGSLRGHYAIIDMSSRRPNEKGKFVRAADLIVKHEYVHFILSTTTRVRYPYWYEEGFAEYLATARYEDGHIRLGFPVADRHMSLSDTFGLSSMENLLSSTRADRKVNVDTFYGQSWLLVHHLMTTPALRPKVVDYLKRYDETGDSLGAFKEVFDIDLGELKGELEGKVRKARYQFTQLTPATPIPEAAVSVAPMSETEARLALAGALLQFPGGDRRVEQVRGYYERVLAGDPANVPALTGLADLALRQRDTALAASFLGKAPDTRDEALLIARGDLAIMRAAQANLPENLLVEARERYLAALTLNNRSAEALFSYGLTYLGSNGDPKEGLAGFREAAALAPGDSEAAFFHALMQLQAGNFEEAARLGRQTALGNREPELVAFGNLVMALAAARDAEGGRAFAREILIRHLTGKLVEETEN